MVPYNVTWNPDYISMTTLHLLEIKDTHTPFRQLNCTYLVLYVLKHTPVKFSFVGYVHCNFQTTINTFTCEHSLSMKMKCHKSFRIFFIYSFSSKLWLYASRKSLLKQAVTRFGWVCALACHWEILHLMLTSFSGEESELPFFLPQHKILSQLSSFNPMWEQVSRNVTVCFMSACQFLSEIVHNFCSMLES